MTPDQAAWVRDHAWPPADHPRRHHFGLPTTSTCSCQDGPCPGCARGQHDECFTAEHGPDADMFLTSVDNQNGDLVAKVICLPGQKPCTYVCPCTCRTQQRKEPVATPRRKTTRSTAPAAPAGQLDLFQAVAA
ncbi:DUF6248 family natural product biosynthesis protein [Streptomyces sp. NPDC058534]|uniref:DUF6248 family natural product biosynthesis protein n=1 Tax=Streptomyces sp. NPDC058534 TaxID=3346541 RepID=UPI003650433A